MKTQTIVVMAFAVASALATRWLTPLTIDEHPCRAQNLKNAVTYICDSDGNVRCINGWEKDPLESPATPCSTPVCKPPCGPNGICIRPDLCACNVGWEGQNCSKCIDIPGCEHGSCEKGGKKEALTCKCDNGWSGGLCDIPSCSGCKNGACVRPNKCNCYPGWKGSKCDKCVKHPACKNGNCKDSSGLEVGHGCFCDAGYTGQGCDQLDCSLKGCVNGECRRLANNAIGCFCDLGWKGKNCTTCIPQPTDCVSGKCVNNVPWTCQD